ncbi:hypothetical protein CA13_32560 [Planctomycetes bacterium CA13]|uniref:Vitamin K-dependent gamma-carboxylase n=1 Tax=Novipirellula herctigrandis TaxID=2527986 RepID=A0A5C5Z5F7_9BACT|nr:hypothetical protein CA13_32560 [Planctomycetes bacterium CA13]
MKLVCAKPSDWWLPRIWALMLLALVAGTFPLWLGGRTVLAVPMIGSAANLPTLLHGLPMIVLVVACVVAVVGGRYVRCAWWCVALSLCLSFLLNQHRLQPWAYQSAIYATVFATMDRLSARRWLIPMAASLYLYSGLGKLDYQFAHTVGQDFLSAIALPRIGSPVDWFEHHTLAWLAFVLPACEAVIAVGLLIPKTRRFAGGLVILMHLTLLAILGPWNLGHSLGVLLWNTLLSIQAWFLFVVAPDEAQEAKTPNSKLTWIPISLLVVAIVMPTTERFGIWDHWPSWALYSPHNSRVDVEIHRSSSERLPDDIAIHLSDRDGDGWNRFDMAGWSLAKLRVPIYPQSRFQLAVASQLASENGLGRSIRVIVRGVSNRRTGQRTEQPLLGSREIDVALDGYWLASPSIGN